MAVGKMTINLADYRGSKSSMSLYHAELAAANIDAHIGALGLYEDFATALAGISLGNSQTIKALAQVNEVSSTPATDPSSLIGVKWLCTYSDDVTGKSFQFEIPCADVTNGDLRAGDTDQAVLTETEWVAFISAFEALAKSPDGNAVTFVGARIVNRNIQG